MVAEFTIRQLRYFIAVAEEHSLKAAAERLYISQPALSSAITELEIVMGVQLCVRRKARGVELTPNGEFFYERAVKLVREADELMWSSRADGGPLRGPLTIGVFVSLAPELIPHYLTAFPALHPGVTLRFREGPADELVAMLWKGEVDIAILYDMDVDRALRRQPLFERLPRVLLPHDHPLAEQDEVALQDLADEPFIQIETSPAVGHTAALMEQAGVQPRVRMSTRNVELAQRMVAKGLGYSLLLTFPARTVPVAGLVHRPVTPEATPVPIIAAWSGHGHLNSRAAAFLEFLKTAAVPAEHS